MFTASARAVRTGLVLFTKHEPSGEARYRYLEVMPRMTLLRLHNRDRELSNLRFGLPHDFDPGDDLSWFDAMRFER